MELKDRIENIKAILPFCSRWSDEVKIVSEEVDKFFANLFSSDDRFKHPRYDRVFPRIFLSEYLNTDYKTHSKTIGIEYTSEYGREGEYRESYDFNDADLEDTYFGKLGTKIEYSEVPDHIWAIIQDELYKNAVKTIQDDLKSASKEVDRCTNKFIEFNKLEINKDE